MASARGGVPHRPPPGHLAPLLTLPSLYKFLELPLTVQHSFDSYPFVDAILADLEVTGNFYQAAQMADGIITDDRVNACVSTRVNAPYTLPMEFKWVGQDDGDGSEDDPVTQLKQKICKLAEQNFEQMLPSGALREISRSGILLNAGFGELVWKWGEGDQALWTPTLKSWNTQSLWWRFDTRSFWVNTVNGSYELHPGDGRWVMFTPLGVNHSWMLGLIRCLGKLWLDRMFAFRDWARNSEKWALGLLKAYAPSDANDDDKARFMRSMTNPANETTVLLPTTEGGNKFDLEMLSTDSSSTGYETFKERIRQLDESIAVALLGQNLTTTVTQGSRAAAQVHENVRRDYMKSDVEVLSSMIKTQVYAPWVQYNWGFAAKELGIDWHELVPNVTWIVDPPEDKKAAADAIFAISQSVPNFAGTDVDLRALFEQHGIPTLEQRAAPTTPPPGGDVVERPEDDPEDVEEEPLSPGLPQFINRRNTATAKRGARKGQLFVDDMADAAKAAGANAMDPTRQALLAICQSAENYDEIRTRVKDLYAGMKPGQMRKIVEQAIVAAQLVGRLSAEVDRKHG